MLDVVAAISKERIGNRCCMAIQTRCLGVHKVARVMVNVMGKEIKRRAVVNIAVTLGTVAGDPAVLQGAVSVMTGGTGIMLDVVAAIDKGLTGGNGRAMAILTGCCKRHTVGGRMVYVMGVEVQRRTVVYIAVALGTVAGDPAVLQRTVSVMTGGTVIVLDVVGTIYKGLTGSDRRCMAGGAVRCQRHVTGAGMIDTMIGPDTAAVAVSTDRIAAGTAGSQCNQRQVRGAGMTGGTGIMLLVIAGIGKGRIGNCCGMTIQTGSLGVHTAGGVMINVMGKQVQRTTIINITMTTRTVAAAYSARCCCNQAVVVTSRINVTGGTGVMHRVVGRINGETGSNGGVMAGIAVTGNRKRYTAGGNVIDAMSTGVGIMTGLAVSTAAGTR